MSKETISGVIASLRELDKNSKTDDPKSVRCLVSVSDDIQKKVAVVKAKEPFTYDVMLIEKIDDIMFKEKLKLHEKVKGKRETAKLVCKLINGGVK